MAELVDRLATESKVPVDYPDRPVHDEILEPGLLCHLPLRRVSRRLAGFQVALGEAPVAIGVADQEKAWLDAG